MNHSLRSAITLAILSVAAASSFAAPAATTTFDFAHLTSNNNGGTGGTTPVSGYTKCTTGDLCSSNVDSGVFGGSLDYKKNGFEVLASATFFNPTSLLTQSASVVQDHISGSEVAAGLGVYHVRGNSSDDNVTTGETLKMSFNQVVKLSSIGLSTEGHTTSWTGQWANKTFEYRVDSGAWKQTTLASNVSLTETGKDFYFRLGSARTADQFYLGAMTVAAVPEPETYAMLLAGLGLMGAVARRRKAKQAA
jgi:hypothetical protein